MINSGLQWTCLLLMNGDVMEKEYPVKSLAKAMKVLECFTVQEPELGVSEIARKLDMLKTTVYNILSTFERMGYVCQNPCTEKYYLGTRMLRMAYVINNHMGLRDLFLPYLEKVAETCGEVCYLGIPQDGEVLYIESVYPSGQARLRNLLGERAPMHCTGIGKAMLAYMEIPDKELSYHTPQTICDLAILREEMEQVRQCGYAIDNMEHEIGIKCVAIPIFGADGQVMAAVSVSGPSMRFDEGTIQRHVQALQNILMPLQYCL